MDSLAWFQAASNAHCPPVCLVKGVRRALERPEAQSYAGLLTFFSLIIQFVYTHILSFLFVSISRASLYVCFPIIHAGLGLASVKAAVGDNARKSTWHRRV